MAVNWRRPFDLLGLPLIGMYLLMTLSQEFPSTALALLLLKEANFSPEELLWFRTLQFLPWSWRFFFGCFSDAVPIAGYRRRPYVFLCNALAAIVYGVLACFARSFYPAVALGMALSVLQCWAEVCLDATAVEVGNGATGDQVIDFDTSCLDPGTETESDQPINADERPRQGETFSERRKRLSAEVQGTAMIARSTGSFIAAGLATLLSLFVGAQILVLLTSITSLVACAVAWRLPDYPVKRDWQQLRVSPLLLVKAATTHIKHVGGVLVQTMLAPLIFVLAYNSIPTSDVIVFSFLASIESEFSATILQSLTLLALLAALMGSLMYSAVLVKPPLRLVFVFATLLSALAQAAYILLATHVNATVLHIPDTVFVFGATAISSCIGRIALIPTLTLAAQSCPKGLEATVFSGFGSIAHLGALASGGLSGLLARHLSITSTDFTRLPLFIGICCIAQLLPLLLLQFVPSTPSTCLPSLALGRILVPSSPTNAPPAPEQTVV
eukprot:TRINITY_DN18067_c0_g1_i1.p1 TRINITY_DN18067_c0_g1~~TRINITY_DN18067_c0_g1_i1.p1  ORF type:complete len:508 (+),score=65.16 TRINITY_DN18067_c0_g1_i1:30-1526(+)